LARWWRRSDYAGGCTGSGADARAYGCANRAACYGAYRRPGTGAYQGAACGTLAGVIGVRAAGESGKHQHTDHACPK
jgi:hypothetical protein